MFSSLSSGFSRRFTCLALLVATPLTACAAPVASDEPTVSTAEALHTSCSTHITDIVAGYETTYALAEDGTVWAWGANNMGALGTGAPPYNSNSSSTPVRVPVARAKKL